MKLVIKNHATFLRNFCPSVALENNIVNSLLPTPAVGDLGSVNKIIKINSKPIRTQILSVNFIIKKNYSP